MTLSSAVWLCSPQQFARKFLSVRVRSSPSLNTRFFLEKYRSTSPRLFRNRLFRYRSDSFAFRFLMTPGSEGVSFSLGVCRTGIPTRTPFHLSCRSATNSQLSYALSARNPRILQEEGAPRMRLRPHTTSALAPGVTAWRRGRRVS